MGVGKCIVIQSCPLWRSPYTTMSFLNVLCLEVLLYVQHVYTEVNHKNAHTQNYTL